MRILAVAVEKLIRISTILSMTGGGGGRSKSKGLGRSAFILLFSRKTK